MKIETNIHHVIPISINGEDKKENKIVIPKTVHDYLHLQQNIPYNIIRQYRERTNHILIPTPKSLDEKCKVWKAYFSWICRVPQWVADKQIESLIWTRDSANSTLEDPYKLWVEEDAHILSEQITEVQKRQVYEFLQNYKK